MRLQCHKTLARTSYVEKSFHGRNLRCNVFDTVLTWTGWTLSSKDVSADGWKTFSTRREKQLKAFVCLRTTRSATWLTSFLYYSFQQNSRTYVRGSLLYLHARHHFMYPLDSPHPQPFFLSRCYANFLLLQDEPWRVSEEKVMLRKIWVWAENLSFEWKTLLWRAVDAKNV